MKKETLRKRNLGYLFAGYFFISLSTSLLLYFLPLYLKEKGLTILQIGTILTIGMAIGVLIVSLVFSRLQKKIKLRSGLSLSALLYFITSFIFYIIPNSIGVVISRIFSGFGKSVSWVAWDVTIQHNSDKKTHRKASSIMLIVDSFAVALSLMLSVILIKRIGFVNSALLFSFASLIGLILYSRVKDDTRFVSKKQHKLPKIALDLKLILLSELLYWFGLATSSSLVITFLVTDYLSGSIGWIAVLYAAGYTSIAISTLLTKRFLDKLDLRKSSILGMSILLLSALVIIVSRNIYLVLLAMVLEGIGVGAWLPSKTALYWGRTKPELREVVSGYLSGLRNFFSTLGPLAGGLLVTYFGIISPFYLKAAIAIISIAIYAYLLFRR
jgi:MFS family permease